MESNMNNTTPWIEDVKTAPLVKRDIIPTETGSIQIDTYKVGKDIDPHDPNIGDYDSSDIAYATLSIEIGNNETFQAIDDCGTFQYREAMDAHQKFVDQSLAKNSENLVEGWIPETTWTSS